MTVEPARSAEARTTDVLVCFCTHPDRDGALALARTLVDEHLVACVQVLPGVESIYRWDDNVTQAVEIPLILKTTRARFDALRARIVALHPYTVPELVALDAVAGLPAYLAWVADNTVEPSRTPLSSREESPGAPGATD